MERESEGSVLLVDRDHGLGREIVSFLRDAGYAVEWVDDGEKAFNRLDTHSFEVLIAELNIRRVDGMRLMRVAQERNPDVCVIFIAEPSDVGLATEAMRQGAYDFQIRPVNLTKLLAVMQRGLRHQRLVLEQHDLRRRLDEQYGLGRLIGNSRAMLQAYNLVRQTAPTEVPVLICGEAGTGKDLFAQAIHGNSSRRNERFVKVSCGNLGSASAEALFGESAGRTGRLDLADRGTLYLDEIGDLAPSLQDRLVDVLDRHHYTRAGDGRTVSADVRVLASSSKAAGAVALGERLRARFRGSTIELPPLRERREDVPLLALHFLREAARDEGRPVREITPATMDLLMRHDWPGNVRELRTLIEGLVQTGGGTGAIRGGDIPAYIQQSAGAAAGEIRIRVGTPMDEVERTMITETMKAVGFDKETCARTLGIGLRTLYRKLKEYGSL